jgi:DNA repair exonuclease SbcCD ATPase subunit
MQIDQDFAGLVMQGVQLVWTVGLTLYVAVVRSDAKLQRRIDDLERNLSSQAGQMERFDERIKNALTLEALNKELAELYRELKGQRDSLSSLGSAVSGLTKQLEAVDELTRRMDTFLRKQSA